MRRGIGGGVILAHKLPVHNLQPLGRTATSIQTTTRRVKLPKLQSSSLDLPRLGMKVPEETTCYPRLVVFAFNAIKFISRFIGVVISGAGKQKKCVGVEKKTSTTWQHLALKREGRRYFVTPLFLPVA